jgi:diadenosine tetraphosphatase ApaH/serine/threonine PP2A family protein phosphatase
MDRQVLAETVEAVLRSRMPKSDGIQHLLKLESILDLLATVQPILNSEPTVLRLSGPIRIVGDIHGNIDDLLRIFAQCQYPPYTQYLFLGDYVDRGDFGVEVMVLLFALKLKFPKRVFLLRGNHETWQVSKSYGFARECRSKFNDRLFSEMNHLWTYLPIAAIIEDSIFCVHGGISPIVLDLEELEQMPKPKEALTGAFIDLLWSDPLESEMGYAPNPRGVGCTFNEQTLTDFLENNDLQLLVRSHESCSGIQFSLPHCLTVFSCSDYSGQGNCGAVLTISHTLEIQKHMFGVLTRKCQKRVILPDWLIEDLAVGQHSLDCSDSTPEDIGIDLSDMGICV